MGESGSAVKQVSQSSSPLLRLVSLVPYGVGLLGVIAAFLGYLTGVFGPTVALIFAVLMVVVMVLFQTYVRVLAGLALGDPGVYLSDALEAPNWLIQIVIPIGFTAGIAIGYWLWL